MQQRGVPGLQTGKKAGVAPEVPMKSIWEKGMELRAAWASNTYMIPSSRKTCWSDGFRAAVTLLQENDTPEAVLAVKAQNDKLRLLLTMIVVHHGSMAVTKELDLNEAIIEAGIFLDGI